VYVCMLIFTSDGLYTKGKRQLGHQECRDGLLVFARVSNFNYDIFTGHNYSEQYRKPTLLYMNQVLNISRKVR
jgi:hypothetical protein